MLRFLKKLTLTPDAVGADDARGLRWVGRILLEVGYGAGSVPG